jgi:hypothetical protein
MLRVGRWRAGLRMGLSAATEASGAKRVLRAIGLLALVLGPVAGACSGRSAKLSCKPPAPRQPLSGVRDAAAASSPTVAAICRWFGAYSRRARVRVLSHAGPRPDARAVVYPLAPGSHPEPLHRRPIQLDPQARPNRHPHHPALDRRPVPPNRLPDRVTLGIGETLHIRAMRADARQSAAPHDAPSAGRWCCTPCPANPRSRSPRRRSPASPACGRSARW